MDPNVVVLIDGEATDLADKPVVRQWLWPSRVYFVLWTLGAALGPGWQDEVRRQRERTCGPKDGRRPPGTDAVHHEPLPMPCAVAIVSTAAELADDSDRLGGQVPQEPGQTGAMLLIPAVAPASLRKS